MGYEIPADHHQSGPTNTPCRTCPVCRNSVPLGGSCPYCDKRSALAPVKPEGGRHCPCCGAVALSNENLVHAIWCRHEPSGVPITDPPNEQARILKAGVYLAIRVLQSDLYRELDERERDAVDEFLKHHRLLMED